MVNVSMGYNCQVGWHEESTYNEGMNAGSSMTAAGEINNFGIVTDFNLTATMERHNTYGIGTQTRINDPILRRNYEWSITVLWQQSQADDTPYMFANNVIDNMTSTLWDSYCFRVQAVPGGGATTEYLYLEGCVVTDISFKASVGDILTMEVSGWAAAVYGDNWTATVFPTGTSMPSVVSQDPEPWHGSDVDDWTNLVDIGERLQNFNVDINFNPAKIESLTGSSGAGEAVLGAPGATEISWSCSYYGDDASMGVDTLLEDLIGDQSATGLTFDLDGVPSTLTLAYASIDSISYPFKEKEVVIMDMEGKANTVALN